MSESRQGQEELFEAALRLPAAERSAFLDHACAGEAELRHRVEALLGAFDRAGGFMNQPATPERKTRPALPPTEKPGDRIGRYKLLEQIGEGGCGVVYVAEQDEPVRRRVALKVIKLGMDTKQVIARFDAERQALALMDHPNIAKIHDAGTTDTGRPYFVMELVRGVKITDYCDQHQLLPRERLDLFIQVCRAIQHAHQKGVIHRDIKPSNILVTVNDGEAVPKVIDFGIAKATQGRLTDQTVYTAFEQFIGTPAYMSPEQAVMTSLDIDTRSDIYSLGVLLYELLTGTTPFDAKELLAKGLDEMRRTIREVEPVRPSTRLTQTAKSQASNPRSEKSASGHRPSQISSDLDWIVMKCLEKDRARRYETAIGLATDLLRHLNNEPIVARPPSKLYEFQKAVRRHKVGFAVTVAIFILLAGGIAVTTWQAERTAAALNELRSTAPAFAAEARSLAAKERFDEAIDKLNYAIKLRPDVPEYWVAKGDLLQSQLQLAEAAVAYREALRLKLGLTRAEASAKLCDELIAANPASGAKLTRESLAKLHVAMQQQQRPAAELMHVARLLGEEKKLLLEYWLDRLKDLPVSAERPLKERLTARNDGLLALDLSDTQIADLSLLTGMPLGSLDLAGCQQITDFARLGEFRSLVKLTLKDTPINNLAPLTGLPLEELDLTDTQTFDLEALRGMKLKNLVLRGTRVGNLSPLAGMPITSLDTTLIPAVDYSPLTGAPLKECSLQASPVRDLSFLRDSQVEVLSLAGSGDARGFAVLAGLKLLNLLVLPTTYRSLPQEDLAAIAALRTHPALRNIDTNERRTGVWMIQTAQTAEGFWKFWDREEAFTRVLREGGFKHVLIPLPGDGYRLIIENQPLTDVSFLKDVPITELIISGTSVTDLRPLEGLPLTRLNISRTPIKDLSPLRGTMSATLRELVIWAIPATDFSPVATCTNLEFFDAADTALADLEIVRGRKLRVALLSVTKITDISLLAGMPLERLALRDTAVTNLSPLLQCPTLAEFVPPRGVDLTALRALPRLARVSYDERSGGFSGLTAEGFWLTEGAAIDVLSSTAESSRKNPSNTMLAVKVAALQVWFGQEAEYAATIQHEIAWAKSARNPNDFERIAKLISLRPISDSSVREAALRFARRAVELGANNKAGVPWYSMSLGMAEYRSGNYAEAIRALTVAEEAAGLDNSELRALVRSTAAFYRAMSLFQQGHPVEARALFTAAEAEMMPLPADAKTISIKVSPNLLVLWLAYKEAKTVIEGQRATGP